MPPELPRAPSQPAGGSAPDPGAATAARHAGCLAGTQAGRTTLHQLALTVPLEQTEPAIAERVRRGVPFDLAAQPRVRWRSNYVRDPEGNVVERGAFGPAVLEQPE